MVRSGGFLTTYLSDKLNFITHMPQAINFIGFQLLWLACVISASINMQWLGLLIGSLALGWHIYAAAYRPQAIKLLCYIAVVGCLFDQLLYLCGLLQFSHWQAALIPPWMVMLWLGFASTLNVSLGWMRGKYWIGAVFGAIGGPLSYLAAQKLGAITVLQTQGLMIALAVGWALMMPMMLWIAPKLNGFAPASTLIRN